MSKFQGWQAGIEQIQAEVGQLTPPPEFEEGHSILCNALEMEKVVCSECTRSLDMCRRFETGEQGIIALNSTLEVARNADDTMEKAMDIIYPSQLGTVFAVGAAFLVVPAFVVVLLVSIGRRRRRSRPSCRRPLPGA